MKKIVTSLLLGLGILASSYGQNEVIDQKNENLAAANGAAEPRYTSAIFSYAQSFKAGKTGNLTAISIHVKYLVSSGTFKMQLLSGAGFGGSVLSETYFQVVPNNYPPLNSYYKIDFPTPFEVQEGSMYSFTMIPESANSQFGIDITADTEYTNGTMYFLNSDVGVPQSISRDAIFRTYVTPPCAATASTTYASSCGIYYWNGLNCDVTGIYKKTLVNAGGCDSIATLNFTRNEATNSISSATACNAYIWNGKTYNESGTYTVNGLTRIDSFEIFPGYFQHFESISKFVNASGCDSSATLNLTINDSKATTTNVSSCGAYEWEGQTYFSSGTYSKTLMAATGCDSVATLKLTITPIHGNTETVSACGSYEWHGETFNENGAYTTLLVTEEGCDSIITLNLTFNVYEGATDTVVACGSYEWQGEVYDEAGTYNATLPAHDGCDSTVYLVLSFNSSIDFSEDFMYNSCNSDIFFTSKADSLVKINGQVIEGKSLIKWGEYYDYSSYTSNHFPDGINGAPDGYSWIPNPNDEESEDHYFIVSTTSRSREMISPVSGGKVIVNQTLNPGAIKEVYVMTSGGDEATYELIASPTPALVSSNSPVIAEFPFTNPNVIGVKIVLTKEFGLLHGIDAIGIETSQLEYRFANAPTGEYTIEAISKGGCTNTQVIEFLNNNIYDTITETSCEAFTYYDYDLRDEIIISKSGIYTYKTEGDYCYRHVYLDFTYTGVSFDTTIITCDDEYYWEDADMNLDETGMYSYQFHNEETGCDSVVNINFIMNQTPDAYFAMSEPDGSFCMKTLLFGSEADSVKLNGVVLVEYLLEEGPPFPVYNVENLKDMNYTLEFINAGEMCPNVYTWLNKVANYDTLRYESCAGIESPSGKFINETGVYQDTIYGEGEGDCEVVYTIYYTDTTFDATISFVEGTLQTDYVTATATYTWFDCDTEEEIEESGNSITPPYDGSFNVVVEDNGCTVITNCYDIIATGNNKSTASTLLNIYPNPSSGNFTVELNSNQNYEVINSLGINVMKGTLQAGVNALDLRSLNEGIYFLTIDAQVTKLIVRK